MNAGDDRPPKSLVDILSEQISKDLFIKTYFKFKLYFTCIKQNTFIHIPKCYTLYIWDSDERQQTFFKSVFQILQSE